MRRFLLAVRAAAVSAGVSCSVSFGQRGGQRGGRCGGRCGVLILSGYSQYFEPVNWESVADKQPTSSPPAARSLAHGGMLPAGSENGRAQHSPVQNSV
ncbi:unnamed protein product [[Candida] boidinii]|uniref:Unnamed protein product n=1 Tax=Candida boidinii TaxID=5477 RepID=A0ACB5TIR3_CANBO|nr:unnamed protein product [[Candida] boidinii]